MEKIKKEEAECQQLEYFAHGQSELQELEKELSRKVEAQHQFSEKLKSHFSKLQEHTKVLDDLKNFIGIVTEHREAFQKAEDKLKSIPSTKEDNAETLIKCCEDKSEECEKMARQCQQVTDEYKHCLEVMQKRLNECHEHLNMCTSNLTIFEEQVDRGFDSDSSESIQDILSGSFRSFESVPNIVRNVPANELPTAIEGFLTEFADKSVKNVGITRTEQLIKYGESLRKMKITVNNCQEEVEAMQKRITDMETSCTS